MGMVDLLSGLLAAKQVLKLWPEKGLDGDRSYFCFFKNETLFFAIFFTY